MPYNYTLPTNVGLGASAGTATIGGVAHVNTTPAATTGTTEQILATYTLPANALSANGKGVRITAYWSTAANANSKTYQLRFGGIGGTVLGGTTTTANNLGTRVVAELFATGTNTQKAFSQTNTGTVAPSITIGTVAATTSAAIDIVATGTTPTAAGDVTFQGMLVEFMN